MKRLILGAGKKTVKTDIDTFLDLRPFKDVDIVHNLDILPWPIKDNEYTSVCAVHLVEHLKSLTDFMNECHRIISPGGTLYLETPLAGVNPDLEFADPTHVRCYRLHSFINYFTPEGIHEFGYTDKAWNFFVSRVQFDCIIIHAIPIK